MSKKKNKKKQPQKQSGQSTKASSAESPVTVEGYEAKAREEGIAIPDDIVTEAVLDRLNAVSSGYKMASDALQVERDALEKQAEDCARKELELGPLRIELEKQQNEMKEERSELAKDRNGLNAREKSILAREVDAAADFTKYTEKELGKFFEEIEQYRGRVSNFCEMTARETMNAIQSIDLARERLFKSQKEHFENSEKSVLAEKNELQTKIRELNDKERQLQWDTQAVQEEKEQLDDHINSRAETRIGLINQQLEDIKVRYQETASRCQDLEEELRTFERANRDVGHLSPAQIQEEQSKTRSRIASLEEQLASRPSEADAIELRQLRDLRDGWFSENKKLQAELGRTKTQLDAKLIEVDTHQNLEEVNKALKANQDMLRLAIRDLEEQHTRMQDDKGAFPELVKMDKKSELQSSPGLLYPPSGSLDLQHFCLDLRARLANGKPSLFYREEDIRAFVAGLAMSRLHLVQGISGIGKSSLPRAFAEAVGGFCDTVSVQAGWRDRNDLFGYYNSFEKKYYETAFVQGLYKAQQPFWEDRIAIILLDEMNLSHPEQYGADLLDVLERPNAKERNFDLIPREPTGAKPQMLAEGRRIALPRNVWFVGTANHDETTRDFAPKTFDRSFVLELPDNPIQFSSSTCSERHPISHKSLIDAFANAKDQHGRSSGEVMDWLDKNLRQVLAEKFEIGWGGRLRAQIENYVPVVVSTGGTIWDAIDQLASTRLLRTIRGKHDNQEDDLVALGNAIYESWGSESGDPQACFKLIDKELHRIGSGHSFGSNA